MEEKFIITTTVTIDINLEKFQLKWKFQDCQLKI